MDSYRAITPTTKQGSKYSISLINVLAKFVITKVVCNCIAATAARFVTTEVILKYGAPKSILMDNSTL
jgi:hypothetical protein